MRMLTLVLLLSLLWAALAHAQDQPITNGSFETVGPTGVPVDWSFLGGVTVSDEKAHSGERSLRLERPRGHVGEVGINRAWDPASGGQGSMLAQTKGAIRFWYTVEPTDAAADLGPEDGLTVQIIPMTIQSLERANMRVVYFIPPAHVGDGQWRQGAFAYDFSAAPDVQWVHVSARILSPGYALFLDDFEWVEQVGPVLQPARFALEEAPGEEGERAVVTLTLGNIGDAASAPTEAALLLPPTLAAEALVAAVPPIEPGDTLEIAWEVVGPRDQAGQILGAEVATEAGAQTRAIPLEPRVVPVRLQLSAMLCAPDEPLSVSLIARNEGTATGGLDGTFVLTAPDGLAVTEDGWRGRLRPGTEGEVARYQVSSATPLPYGVVTLSGPTLDAPFTAPIVCASPADSVRDESIARNIGGWSLSVRPVAPGADPSIVEVAVDGGPAVLLPRLGLLATPSGETPLSGALGPGQAREGEGASLILTDTREIDGVTWDFRWDLELVPEADRLRYRLSATPQADTEYLALEGPMVYVGEGSPVTRSDAILPGLEWLVEGEESSSALDILPDHPDRDRYVPHPLKVTVPAVAVMTDAGPIGLLWDAPTGQDSYEAAGPLALVFATPNRFEGHGNHLMGLQLPAPGWGVQENSRRASEPIALAAGQELVIACEILIDPDEPDSLSVVERWYERGFPAPLPYPRGSAEDEVRFSLEAYFPEYELWNPEWSNWYSDLIVGFRPSVEAARFSPWASEILGDDPTAERFAELAALALQMSESGLTPAVQYRAEPTAIWSSAEPVRRHLASQDENGLWAWSGAKASEYPEGAVDYSVLGRLGDHAIGLNTDHAATILTHAILTGDPEAIEGGLKCLRGMRRFRVPRAAQVWEVPVHTPDILASARAVDAYLLGYQLTGDEEYLADAVYWARTGLPFVYAWNDPERPALQGATIPVFGATAYVLSWFGVAVQWNGLAYSNSLYALARYDDSYPWVTIADNILRSGMYQQVEEGSRRGQWPDAVNFIEGRPGLHGQTPPCFQPATILRQHLARMGYPTAPVLEVAHQGGEFLAVRSIARFGALSWERETLTVPLEMTPPQRGAVEVIGVTRPTRVLLDGQPLAESEGSAASDDPGWRWHEQASLLEVRIGESGAHVITVEGARRSPYVGAPVRRAIDFAFDADSEGWEPAHDLADFTISDGLLRTSSTGADPYMTCHGLAVEGSPGDVLVIRLAASAGDAGCVFWATVNAPGFSPEREIPFGLAASDDIKEIRVPVGDHQAWAGQTITSLRIDPTSGATGAEVRIESISLERR